MAPAVLQLVRGGVLEHPLTCAGLGVDEQREPLRVRVREQERSARNFSLLARTGVLVEPLAGGAVPLAGDAGMCTAATTTRRRAARKRPIGSCWSSSHL